jgi:hypothetical protein
VRDPKRLVTPRIDTTLSGAHARGSDTRAW